MKAKPKMSKSTACQTDLHQIPTEDENLFHYKEDQLNYHSGTKAQPTLSKPSVLQPPYSVKNMKPGLSNRNSCSQKRGRITQSRSTDFQQTASSSKTEMSLQMEHLSHSQIKSSNKMERSTQIEHLPPSSKCSYTRLKTTDLSENPLKLRSDMERSRQLRHTYCEKHMQRTQSRSAADKKPVLCHESTKSRKPKHCVTIKGFHSVNPCIQSQTAPATECESSSYDQNTLLSNTADTPCNKSDLLNIHQMSRSFVQPECTPSNKTNQSKHNKTSSVLTNDQIPKQRPTSYIKTLGKMRIEEHSHTNKCFQGKQSRSVASLKTAQSKELETSDQLKESHSLRCLRTRSRSTAHSRTVADSACMRATPVLCTESESTQDKTAVTNQTQSSFALEEIAPNKEFGRSCHAITTGQMTKLIPTEHKHTTLHTGSERLKKNRRSCIMKSDRVLRPRTVSCSEVSQNHSAKQIVQVMNLNTGTKRMNNTTSTETAEVSSDNRSMSKSATPLHGKKRVQKTAEVRFAKRLRSGLAAHSDTVSLDNADSSASATCSETCGIGSTNKLKSITLKQASLNTKTRKTKLQETIQRNTSSSKKGAAKIKKTIVTNGLDVNDQINSANVELKNKKSEFDNRPILDVTVSSLGLPPQQSDTNASDGFSQMEQFESRVIFDEKPHTSSSLSSDEIQCDCLSCTTHTVESPSIRDIEEEDEHEEDGPCCHRLFTYDTEYEYHDSGDPADGVITSNLHSVDDSFTLGGDFPFRHTSSDVSASTLAAADEYQDKEPISSMYETFITKRPTQQTCNFACQTDVSLNVQSDISDNEAASLVMMSGLSMVRGKNCFEDITKMPVEESEEIPCEMSYNLKEMSRNLLGDDAELEEMCGSSDVYDQEVLDPVSHTSEVSDLSMDTTVDLDTGKTSQLYRHRNVQSESIDCDPLGELQPESDNKSQESPLSSDVSQGSSLDQDKSSFPVDAPSSESEEPLYPVHTPVLNRRNTDITYENVRSLRTKTYFGQHLRGSSGWEESLRQHPARTNILQVGHDPRSPKRKTNERRFSSAGECNTPVREDAEPMLDSGEKKKSKNRLSFDSKPESTPKKRKTSIIVLENDRQMNSVMENEPNYGKLVWARLAGERWWPGMVIKGSQVYLQGDNTNMSWIFWFGDHKVSQIAHEQIMPFIDGYSSKFNKKVKKPAVEALWECWRRNDSPSDLDSEEALLKFAAGGFRFRNESRIWSFEPVPDDPIPEYILTRLKQIGEEIRSRAARKPYSVETHDADSAIEAIRSEQRAITDVCISCLELNEPVVCQHPLFEGGLCQQCKESLMETCYAFAEDGLHAYCTICGHGGKLFICDSLACSRVYCFDCVGDFCGPEISANIQARKSWMCFLCSPFGSSTHGMLRPKTNWEEEMVSFFDTGYRIERPNLNYFKEKRPIRVLSLFDGIGTCKLALDQLGIAVDVYYSSEVDKDALMVTRANHGDSIVQIGDVQLLNYKSQLPQIGPVDLLIGGSPCNDFSLANPDRKGFGGSGVLFFDFFRVLKYLQTNYRDRHLFWLYENVSSMKTEYMVHISRFLECQPALWDSKYFTAQHRARYFWGNIPGLYSTPEISTKLHKSVSLDSSLQANCNRQAVIPKLRTVTTRTNSLKFGKKDEYFPVQMDGMDDGIWIPELERDVGNLPTTRRQKLIGKAWCLPVIKHILSPLKEYFTLKENT